jgi:hypothetical protein
MSRLGVTYDDIAQSAETLLRKSEEPTIEKVRALLGTGSNTTISKYLQRCGPDPGQKVSNL